MSPISAYTYTVAYVAANMGIALTTGAVAMQAPFLFPPVRRLVEERAPVAAELIPDIPILLGVTGVTLLAVGGSVVVALDRLYKE